MPRWKKLWKKTWHFIWEEDSLASWVVNIILAFVIIKFVVYPGLGAILGTDYPIVAVVSRSMEHEGTFDQWWSLEKCRDAKGKYSQGEWLQKRGITREEFEDFPFQDGFNKGDLIILTGAEDAEVGDILVFRTRRAPNPIIHRITGTGDKTLKTKGDNNCDSAPFERNIPRDKVLGKGFIRLPMLGWIKIGAVCTWGTLTQGKNLIKCLA